MFCQRVTNDTTWKGLRQNKRKVCPAVPHFSAGHYVREEVILAGHWAIIAGHCPMSGVYFLAWGISNTKREKHEQEKETKKPSLQEM